MLIDDLLKMSQFINKFSKCFYTIRYDVDISSYEKIYGHHFHNKNCRYSEFISITTPVLNMASIFILGFIVFIRLF